MAIYRFVATGLPVCPTCSPCERHPKSDTGLEQAVAAPNTSARFSINPQFSGPFNPRPPDTTTSASAIVTLPTALSTESTETPESITKGEKSSTEAEPSDSIKPKETIAS